MTSSTLEGHFFSNLAGAKVNIYALYCSWERFSNVKQTKATGKPSFVSTRYDSAASFTAVSREVVLPKLACVAWRFLSNSRALGKRESRDKERQRREEPERDNWEQLVPRCLAAGFRGFAALCVRVQIA